MAVATALIALTVSAALVTSAAASPGGPPEIRAGAISDVSTGCSGQNAEVEQATWHETVYEAWIGCNGIGFARSADGGRTWSSPVEMRGSAGGWDPAVAVAPDGTLYVAFMMSVGAYTYPVVDTSFDKGRTFSRSVALVPKQKNNWGDRDFIVAGDHGVVYVTWDYGPSAADMKYICSPSGSCGYSNGDVNVVVQKSVDYGKTWGPIVHVSPGFPASGGDSAPLVLERGGRIAVAYQGYDIYNKKTFAMKPAYMYFTSSADGGKTWTKPVRIDGAAGTMSLAEWWIDGDITEDAAGNLYVTWDTQGKTRDFGWLSYSRDGGRTWSAAIRVTPDNTNATHIVQAIGGEPGIAYVGWLSDSSSAGYAQYLRVFSLRHGWLSAPVRISRQYGNAAVWPGDTFGISMLSHSTVMLSWGSAVGNAKANSEIYAASVAGTPVAAGRLRKIRREGRVTT
jgi:hypothetical protein